MKEVMDKVAQDVSRASEGGMQRDWCACQCLTY